MAAQQFYGFPDTDAFGQRLAKELGLAVQPVEGHRFPDGESLVCASG